MVIYPSVISMSMQELGALSVNNSVYQYEVPEVGPITNFTNDVNDSKISLYFTVNNVAADVSIYRRSYLYLCMIE